ncbi:MAG: SDR family oxidoreductase [Deltaproteobacteria bacterium]|nr:MAG: SDR family oxidoreductase [Deltaproteobacteria bacterium]
MADFSNKITLITGGACGLGRFIALKMAARGSHVVLWDIADESLAEIATEMSAAGYQATLYHCDVSDREMVYDTADKVRNQVGRVDILMNNAGVVSGRPFLECTDDQLRRTMEVNALAHFWTVKAFLPDMVRANSGYIVTIASAGGIVGSAGLVDYAASKFAAFGFDEALRAELKKQKLNIHTAVVCPYFMKGDMFEGVKTRFSFLLPILNAEQVSERIVNTIARKKRRLIMPPLVYATWPLRLLPVAIFDKAATFLGINDAMDQFRGRRPRSNKDLHYD